MGLGNLFGKQLSQVIEWNNQSPDLLIYKFPSANDEIKNASKLVVAPGQGAVLVYEGQVSDVLNDDGIFNLQTDNHPFITSLQKLRTGFESEHKMKIYFFRTAEVVNQNWGTSQAVKYVDPVYKFPVELGANGTFSYKIADAHYFFSEIAGSRDSYTTSEMRSLLQNRFPQSISTVLATSGLSYQNIDSQLSKLSSNIQTELNTEVQKLGLTFTDFKLNGTIFDSNTQDRINKIANITAESLAAQEGGLTYVELEKLRALRDAARNEGGLAGAGLQLGTGMELGKAFNDKKEELLHTDSSSQDIVAKLQQLKLLLNEQIITQEEFDSKKKELMDKF